MVSRKKNGFYETDIEDADIVVKQALREGIPVVIRQAGKKFESRPFEAQNLAQVVHEQNVQAGSFFIYAYCAMALCHNRKVTCIGQ